MVVTRAGDQRRIDRHTGEAPGQNHGKLQSSQLKECQQIGDLGSEEQQTEDQGDEPFADRDLPAGQVGRHQQLDIASCSQLRLEGSHGGQGHDQIDEKRGHRHDDDPATKVVAQVPLNAGKIELQSNGHNRQELGGNKREDEPVRPEPLTEFFHDHGAQPVGKWRQAGEQGLGHENGIVPALRERAKEFLPVGFMA